MDFVTTDLPQADFKIFSGLLTASIGSDGKKKLRGVASSTTRDLHGDVMEETALQDMERDANNNMTMFLNHSYDVPEDVAGSVTKAVATRRGVDGEGNPNWDLDIENTINEDNERAVKAWTAVNSGTKLGFSIGAMIPEGGASRDPKTKALTISHVNLMEISIVSLPANTRSWISSAVKALHQKEKNHKPISLGSPTMELDGTGYVIRGELEGIQVQQDLSVEMTMEIIEDGETAIADDTTPDVQDASVRIIEIDTDPPKGPADPPPSQEAPSDPGIEEGTEPELAAVTATLVGIDPVVRQTVEATLRMLETTTARLSTTQMQLHEEQAARKAAEAQRDETAEVAGVVMAQARALIERLADTPIGRKASYREVQSDFSHLEGIYSERFLKLLNEGERH